MKRTIPVKPDIFLYSDFRSYLKDFYNYSKQANPRFSHRYFARRAGFSSSNFFYLIIEGKRNLTKKFAPKFAKALGLSKKEGRFFEALVSFNQVEDSEAKRYYLELLDDLKSDKAPAFLPDVIAGRQILKEVRYSDHMDYEKVEKWCDKIPTFAEADVSRPEWKETPVFLLDLTRDGYGAVWIKNEADVQSNPTGTIKDRAAWELITLYRDFAKTLFFKTRTGALQRGDIESIVTPRLTVISAGSAGMALAAGFEKYDLPPPKLIVKNDTNPAIVSELLKFRADIYLADLTAKALTMHDIKMLSNCNSNSADITSIQAIEPAAIFYDWHVHEVFNFEPDEIYIPYESGRLMENYLTWQARSVRNEMEGRRDPRLRAPTSKVIAANVFAVEPSEHPSIADKLAPSFKPFAIFKDSNIDAVRSFPFTGNQTGRYPVSNEYILEAHNILIKHGIDAEPSAAAALALYLERFDEGLVREDKKVVVVNTGKGLITPSPKNTNS